MPSVRRPQGASRVKDDRSFPSIQMDFLQQLENPADPPANADLDIHFQLLGAIKTAIADARGRGLSRERIVDRMNLLLPELDKPITLRQLNSWTAASKEYSEFPARYLGAFCAATGCDLPARVIAQAIGKDLVDARELAAKRLGENMIETARLARERGQLKSALGG